MNKILTTSALRQKSAHGISVGQNPRLMDCPDCDHPISKRAQACPACGWVNWRNPPAVTVENFRMSFYRVFLLAMKFGIALIPLILLLGVIGSLVGVAIIQSAALPQP